MHDETREPASRAGGGLATGDRAVHRAPVRLSCRFTHPHGRKPRRQITANPRHHRVHDAQLCLRGGRAQWRRVVLGRFDRQSEANPDRARAVGRDRPHTGSRARRRAAGEGGPGAVRGSGGDDSTAGGVAHPVHFVGTGGGCENHPDHARHHSRYCSRPGVARGRAANRATHQGTDARCFVVAVGGSCHSAANVAAPHRLAASVDGIGVAVPDRRGGHRLGRRARLPDLSRASLPGDGCHPAVRRLDHTPGFF